MPYYAPYSMSSHTIPYHPMPCHKFTTPYNIFKACHAVCDFLYLREARHAKSHHKQILPYQTANKSCHDTLHPLNAISTSQRLSFSVTEEGITIPYQNSPHHNPRCHKPYHIMPHQTIRCTQGRALQVRIPVQR